MSKDYENRYKDYGNYNNSSKTDINFNQIKSSYINEDNSKGCSCCGCSCLSLICFFAAITFLFCCFGYFVWNVVFDEEKQEELINKIKTENSLFFERLLKSNNFGKQKKVVAPSTKKNSEASPARHIKSSSPIVKVVRDDSKRISNNVIDDKEWKEAYEYIKNGQLGKLFGYTKNSGKDLSKMYYEGMPAVCVAANYEQYEIVKFLILTFDCKTLTNKDGKTALHYAAQKGNTQIIELLLQNSFDVNSRDFGGDTPLFYAITYPFPDSVKLLLEKGANPNQQNNNKITPLHFAIKKSNVLAIKYLMEAGADPNIQDYSGNTPMHYVSLYSRDYKTLDALYDYWNKLDLTIKNKDGKTPKNIRSWDYFDYYKNDFREKFR